MSASVLLRSVDDLGRNISSFIAGQLSATFREMLRGPQVIRDERYILYVTGEPHPFGNLAIIARADDSSSINEAIQSLAPCTAPSAIVLPDAPSAANSDRLQRAGYAMAELMPNMAINISAVAKVGLPSGYKMARVVGPSEGDRWVKAFATGYELPLPVAALFNPSSVGATADPAAPYQFFVILRNGAPVATSMLRLKDGVAGIYCIATIPAERGKGLGAYVTAETLRGAVNQGYSVGILQASAAGHPVYKRLGFEEFGAMQVFVKMPA